VIATALGTSTGVLTSTAAAASLTPAQLKECEKQQTLWHKRLVSLKKMLTGFEASGCPHAPSSVFASVTGQTSFKVQVGEPDPVGQYSLFTKFKVQWSASDTFAKIAGEKVIVCSSDEGQKLECVVDNLKEGQRYFVRASFGNPKGFGPFSAASPKSVVPSTWRSVDQKIPRIRNQVRKKLVKVG
jgi:phosphodiesterase/alkaline phosphatase D-like protein